MDKRYQIFVSSTFADLKEERQIIMRTLMEMGHFPSGMEFFSAIDEEQWPFIEKVIDDSDYYVLILGGRYGSLADEEISYTEKEFDYAKSNNKKIIALVHGSPSSLPVSKTDADNTLRDKLEGFREKVCTGRMVKFWTKSEELAGHVALALPKTINIFPAVGWVRGDRVASQEILEELNALRKENLALSEQVNLMKSEHLIDTSRLVDFDDEYDFELNLETGLLAGMDDYMEPLYADRKQIKITIKKSWREIFSMMAVSFLHERSEINCKRYLVDALVSEQGFSSDIEVIEANISTKSYKQIRTQLLAYGLIDTIITKTDDVSHLSLHLTAKGKMKYLDGRALKK